MTHIRKTYAYTQDGKQVCFHGHISRDTAVKRDFKSVTLTRSATGPVLQGGEG